MKFILKLSFLMLIVFHLGYVAADFQIRSTINKDNDASVAYNSVDDEYLVVWTEYSTVSIEVLGKRMKADGTGSIGAAFSISTIGAFPSVAYNPQSNEYLVTFSLLGNIIGLRVGNTGNVIGSPVTLISKTNSIYSKIIYNTLANNYLLIAGELFDLGNDQANIKIYARKITANGQPTGTEQLVRDQGHSNYSDGARFSVAYAPINSVETPAGRYLLAISSPTDITMLDDNGKIVSRVNDSQHPGNIVGDNVPFQSSKVGIAYNVDVAFGNFEGEDVFMVVWGDRDNQYNNQPWTGIWAGIVPALPIEFESNESVSSTVFPVSAIPYHNITPTFSKTWKPVVAYNEKAFKFMIAWRETPTNDPLNDTKVNHIRANAVSSSIPSYTSNVVLSSISGNEDPKNPVICTSTKYANALVVWEDERNISSKDIDLYGSLFTTTPVKALILTSPNGGEIWQEDTEQQITWESSGIGVSEVKIEYSIDHGASFTLIANQTNADGNNSYNWTVPKTPSTQCKVQITAVGDLSDQSDDLFTIKETPQINLIAPNGGEVWESGSKQQIKWESVGVGDFDVSIQYSTDNGGSYQSVAFYTNVDGLNTFDWEVPNTPSTQSLVHISLIIQGVEYADVSDGAFIIVGPKITVITPNGGEDWYTGKEYEIKWISENFNDPVNIYIYSTNSINSYFDPVVTNTPNDGSYLFTPYDNSMLVWVDEFKIGIADANKIITDYSKEADDGRPFDWSDDFVNLIYSPKITVVSPNGGEVWEVGSQHEIKWTSSNFTDPVRIDVHINSCSPPAAEGLGNCYSGIDTVATYLINTGSFIWTVPSIGGYSAGYRIRVADATKKPPLEPDDGKIYDWSDKWISRVWKSNTSKGSNVKIDLGDGTNINFDQIDSVGATSQFIADIGSLPPSDKQIFPVNNPKHYYIETTAMFSGNIQLCIPYSDSGLTEADESNFQLNVYDTTLSQWVDITTTQDIQNNTICGEVNHLSEFAIMMPTSDGQVLLVTNTNDSGEGSLRRAIDMANEHIGPDTIKFNISFGESNYDGSKGVWLIQPETYLPSILDRNLVIDGTSQRLFIGEDVNKEGPEIEINGINLFESGYFLQSFTNGTEIYELIINDFGSTAIIYNGSSDGIVSGCFIGTDHTGMKAVSNGGGITLSNGVTNTLIGPSSHLEEPNIISGNNQDGIFITHSSQYNTVLGNFIGVNKSATDTIPNKLRGIDLSRGANNNTIMENIVGGNYGGIYLNESNNNLIWGNKIGTNETWEYDLYNSDGIVVFNNSSGNTISENIIGYNKGWGIKISGSNSMGNRISKNSISKNSGFGIDNYEGGNLELSPPVVVSTSNNEISGTAGANQIIEIFADSSDEGQLFIDSTVTDASGNFLISLSSSPVLPFITATARDNMGNTSEFSSPSIVTDIVSAEDKIPTEYALYQNYPNPFNPSTTISYQIPISGHVSIKVYDILGKEIFTLVNQKQQVGKYEVSFNANDFSSGVYFYQLKTKDNTLTKKMLLLE